MQADDKGRKGGKSGARDARLKAALRENLRRRKAQERARSGSTASKAPETPAGMSRDDDNR